MLRTCSPIARPGCSRLWSAALFLAVVLAIESPVAAQGVREVVPGSRVRVTAPDHGLERAVGTVQDTANGGLRVQFRRGTDGHAEVINASDERIVGAWQPGRILTLDRSAITELDVSTAGRRQTLKGLGYGLLAGAVTGAMIGLGSGDERSGCFAVCTAGQKGAFLGVTFGLAGGVVGAIIGASVRRGVWSPVSLTDVDLTVMPLVREHGTGLHVAFGLRFH